MIEILRRGLRNPLTLISVPAGSGKPTLMSEWRAGSGDETQAAWLSLDAGDNDPLRFLTYLTAALESASPGLTDSTASMLQSPQPPPLDALITSLLEALSGLTNDLVLILDHYHVITNTAIRDSLNILLAQPPPLIHLIILARADPPLPLSRMRVRDQLTEIRAADLRFTVDEVVAFLSQTMGLKIML